MFITKCVGARTKNLFAQQENRHHAVDLRISVIRVACNWLYILTYVTGYVILCDFAMKNITFKPFEPNVPFPYSPFSERIEMEHWAKMG